jgi:hypothetical protein
VDLQPDAVGAASDGGDAAALADDAGEHGEKATRGGFSELDGL